LKSVKKNASGDIQPKKTIAAMDKHRSAGVARIETRPMIFHLAGLLCLPLNFGRATE
jgi:hypothetical protein